MRGILFRADAGVRKDQEGLRTAPVRDHSIYIPLRCAVFEFAHAAPGFPSLIEAAWTVSAFYPPSCSAGLTCIINAACSWFALDALACLT